LHKFCGAAVFLSLIRQAKMRYLASDVQGRSVFDRPEKVREHLRLLVLALHAACFSHA
jgi:DNA repair protein RadC